jgi:hypothetical protein
MRLARTTAGAVGVVTVAGLALVGVGAPAATAAEPAVATQATTQVRPCRGTQLLENRHFERPPVLAAAGWGLFGNATPNLGWRSRDGQVELWRGLGTPHMGRQHAEVNSTSGNNTLWQAARVGPSVLPRVRLYWSAAFKARDYDSSVNVDVTQVRLNGRLLATVRATDRGWRVVEGYTWAPRSRVAVFSLVSLRHDGPAGTGNLVDTASLVQCARW